ncbi:MAG: hypothetical protein KUG75_01495 [Pseudomonadales bacterium]|nr:hypothetical protein [Pseudomonadales bacterium]
MGVTPGSGAQKAGLFAGDLFVKINEISIEELLGERAIERLVRGLENLRDGDVIKFGYQRSGQLFSKSNAPRRQKNCSTKNTG